MLTIKIICFTLFNPHIKIHPYQAAQKMLILCVCRPVSFYPLGCISPKTSYFFSPTRPELGFFFAQDLNKKAPKRL